MTLLGTHILPNLWLNDVQASPLEQCLLRLSQHCVPQLKQHDVQALRSSCAGVRRAMGTADAEIQHLARGRLPASHTVCQGPVGQCVRSLNTLASLHAALRCAQPSEAGLLLLRESGLTSPCDPALLAPVCRLSPSGMQPYGVAQRLPPGLTRRRTCRRLRGRISPAGWPHRRAVCLPARAWLPCWPSDKGPALRQRQPWHLGHVHEQVRPCRLLRADIYAQRWRTADTLACAGSWTPNGEFFGILFQHRTSVDLDEAPGGTSFQLFDARQRCPSANPHPHTVFLLAPVISLCLNTAQAAGPVCSHAKEDLSRSAPAQLPMKMIWPDAGAGCRSCRSATSPAVQSDKASSRSHTTPRWLPAWCTALCLAMPRRWLCSPSALVKDAATALRRPLQSTSTAGWRAATRCSFTERDSWLASTWTQPRQLDCSACNGSRLQQLDCTPAYAAYQAGHHCSCCHLWAAKPDSGCMTAPAPALFSLAAGSVLCSSRIVCATYARARAS